VLLLTPRRIIQMRTTPRKPVEDTPQAPAAKHEPRLKNTAADAVGQRNGVEVDEKADSARTDP
jgi:hypothetical protein